MDASVVGPITMDVIAFLSELSREIPEIGREVVEHAKDDPSGKTLRSRFAYAVAISDENTGVPAFHRLVVAKAMLLHVDWEEVADFFANTTTDEGEV